MHPARVLVAHCTRSGSTAGVAGSIAARLREHGHVVDRHELSTAPGPHDYDAVVLGSPVFNGRWMPEADAYVEQHRAALRARQVWLFSVGAFGDTKRLLGSLARREPRNVDALLTAVRPRDYRVFAGAVSPADWPWWSRMLLRAIGERVGDNRDWEVIEAWASEIARELSHRRPENDGSPALAGLRGVPPRGFEPRFPP